MIALAFDFSIRVFKNYKRFNPKRWQQPATGDPASVPSQTSAGGVIAATEFDLYQLLQSYKRSFDAEEV